MLYPFLHYNDYKTWNIALTAGALELFMFRLTSTQTSALTVKTVSLSQRFGQYPTQALPFFLFYCMVRPNSYIAFPLPGQRRQRFLTSTQTCALLHRLTAYRLFISCITRFFVLLSTRFVFILYDIFVAWTTRSDFRPNFAFLYWLSTSWLFISSKPASLFHLSVLVFVPLPGSLVFVLLHGSTLFHCLVRLCSQQSLCCASWLKPSKPSHIERHLL